MSAETPQFEDELLSAYLDDELGPEERARVEAHLAADPAARQLLDELRTVSQSVKELPRESLPADLSEAVLRRAERAMLSSKSSTGEVAVATGLVDVLRKIPIGRSRRAWAWASMAIAAGLVIMIFDKNPEGDADLPGEVAVRDATEVGKLPPLELRAANEPEVVGQPAAGFAGVAAKPQEVPLVADEASKVATEELGRTEWGSGVAGRRGGEVAREDALESDRFTFGGGAAGNVATEGAAMDVVKDESNSAPVQNTDLLVVHVNAKPEALEQKLIDGVLARNGIVVEDSVEESAPTAGSESQLSDSSSTAAATREPRSRPSRANLPQAPPNVDVVLVEAEPAQIAGCLSEIDADRANYLGIEVEDQRSQADQLAEKKASIDWKQHNRGIVPPQQKVQVAPDNNLYLNAEGRQIAIGNYAAQTPLAESGVAMESIDQSAQRGRATRMQTQFGGDFVADGSGAHSRNGDPQLFGYQAQNQAENYGLARRAMQKIVAKADTLQVLFVLTCPTEHAVPAAPPPATSPPPAETVP